MSASLGRRHGGSHVPVGRGYDQPATAFASVLGSWMKDSSALWPVGDATLDAAQENSLRSIVAAMGVRGGERVLDIGCGWGALTLLLAAEHGCHVVAVTPVTGHAEYLTERVTALGLGDRVRVVDGSFPNLPDVDGTFDAVAMVDVIEHFPHRAAALRSVFSLLRQGGRGYLSTTCYRSRDVALKVDGGTESRYAADFLGIGRMTPLSELIAELEDAGFSMTALADLTRHFDRTMMNWQRNIAPDVAATAELNRYLDAARTAWGYTVKHYELCLIRSRFGEYRGMGA